MLMIEPPAHPNLPSGQTNSDQKTSEVKRLLLIACSATKQPDPELLPALDRYQGTWFKVLHGYRRAHPQEAQTLDVWILSAEFGFIAAPTPIPDYTAS
jgi:hypothetical protein